MEASKTKQLGQTLVLGFAMAEPDAHRKRTAAAIRARQIDHTLDAGEDIEEDMEIPRDSGSAKLALEKRGQQQGEHAIRGVDPDLLVGPVQQGPPTDEVGVLHLFKGVLNLGLAAAGGHDLFIGPVELIREGHGLAEVPVDHGLQGLAGKVYQALGIRRGLMAEKRPRLPATQEPGDCTANTCWGWLATTGRRGMFPPPRLGLQ